MSIPVSQFDPSSPPPPCPHVHIYVKHLLKSTLKTSTLGLPVLKMQIIGLSQTYGIRGFSKIWKPVIKMLNDIYIFFSKKE